jgi:KDO2-lipid IV(A) lauroyltransferase
MSWKKIRKTWKRAVKRSRRNLVYLLTILARRAIVCLPLRWARGVGACVGVAAFPLVRKERRRTLENLKLAYGGEMSEGERRRLGREVFRNAGRSAVEAAFLSTGEGGNILTDTRVEGLEHIQGVLESGRGVLAVTAHFGNWELVLAVSALRFPCEVGAVARDLSNPGLNRLVTDLRERCGAQVFTRGQSGRDYVRFLRGGNVLGILGDIDTSKGEGLFVDFFGRPAWTQSGIARLARVACARIVPAFIFRDREDPALQVYRIEPPLEEPPEGLPEEEWIRATTQAFTKAIENAVRERPDLWMWMHRRWRRQPGEARTRRRKPGRGAAPGRRPNKEAAGRQT